jgi:hypothetical protein
MLEALVVIQMEEFLLALKSMGSKPRGSSRVTLEVSTYIRRNRTALNDATRS